MKNIKCESGLRINLPDHAFIEIWEQSGEYLVKIKDSEMTVQICTLDNSNGTNFEYIRNVQEKLSFIVKEI